MNDEIAREIAGHLAKVARQVTAIKWLLVALVVAALALAWFVSHPAALSVLTTPRDPL